MRWYVAFSFSLLVASSPSAGVFTGDWLELIDTSKLPVLRDDVCLQVSSYDRTGGNDDGFSGQFSFLRQDADGGYVIFEETGPGCVYRFWSANPGPRRIEFYFDGEPEPRLAFDKWEDMFLGKVEPFLPPVSQHVLGGWCSYVPLPYEKSLKIVTRERINFYQITYMRFAGAEGVKTFTPQLSDDDRAKLQRVCDAWSKLGEHPWPDPAAKVQYQKWSLAPGQRQTVVSRKGTGIITSLEFAFDGLSEKALRQVMLEIAADGAAPQVSVPLGDFFLQGFPGQNTQSLLCGRKPGAAGTLYCFWPMPFRNGLEVVLVNESPDRLRFKATASTKLLRELPDNMAYFHAKWQRLNPTVKGELFPILEAQGRGHWCGVSMAMQGYTPGHGFLEGDEMLWIDDRDNTAFNGTGSEDYYNGGWYFGGTGSMPYYGCGYHADPEGRCHAYRLHMTDLVPFQQRARIGIEHGHGNEYDADYAGTTFWYAAPETQAASVPAPVLADRMWTPSRLAGALEAEDAFVGGSGAEIVSDASLPVFCSGGKGVAFQGGGAVAELAVNVEQNDLYQVVLHAPEQSNDFDLVANLDGQPPAASLWKFRMDGASARERVLPFTRLQPGIHTLTVTVHAGKPVLDAIRLVPSKKAPDVIEAESLTPTPVGDAVLRILDLEPAGMSGLACGAILHNAPDSGAEIVWTAAAGGIHAIGLRLHASPAQPAIVFTLDGAPLGDPVAFSGGDIGWQTVYRMTPPIDPGEHRVGVRLAPDMQPGGETLIDFLDIRLDGVFEGEELRVIEAVPNDVKPQEMQSFGPQWSHDAQVWFTPNTADARVTFEIQAHRAGPRNVCVYVTKAPDYGTYQVLIDGAPVGDPIDGYHPGVVRSDKMCLGSVDLTQGAHQITFQCTGKNAQSSNYMLGLDLIQLE